MGKQLTWPLAALLIAAGGLAGGALLAGLLWGLGALARGLGAAWAIAASGMVAAPWIGEAVGAAAAGLGVFLAVVVVYRVTEEAKKSWVTALLPIVTLLTGAVVDFGKEAYGGSEVEKGFYAVLAGAVVAASGVLAEQKRPLFRGFAALAALAPPAMYAGLIARDEANLGDVVNGLAAHGPLALAVLAVLGLISLGMVLVAVFA